MKYVDAIPMWLQVKKNKEHAQMRQCEAYARRKEKGVKGFALAVGDKVLKRDPKANGPFGQRLLSKWTGPYRHVNY